MTPQPVRIGKMSESELNEIAKESYRQITGKQPPATAPNGTISTCDVSILHGSCPICPQYLTCKNPQKRIIQQQPAACGAGRHEVREDGIERHTGDGAADSGEDARVQPFVDLLKVISTKRNEMQDIMRRNKIAIDNVQEPMQKLAFTFYSEIAELAHKAEVVIEEYEESLREGAK